MDSDAWHNVVGRGLDAQQYSIVRITVQNSARECTV